MPGELFFEFLERVGRASFTHRTPVASVNARPNFPPWILAAGQAVRFFVRVRAKIIIIPLARFGF